MDAPSHRFGAEHPVKAAHHRQFTLGAIVEESNDTAGNDILKGAHRVRMWRARRCSLHFRRYGHVLAQRQPELTLVKALTRAFRWRRMLEASDYGTIKELAAREKINESCVSRVLRPTLLAPEIVEAVLDGRQPEGMTLPGLMGPFPVEWDIQRCK